MHMHVDHTALVSAGLGLKGLKTWRTPDGGGWQYTLLHHGAVVALVSDDGHGGAIRVEWQNLRWNGEVYVPSDATVSETIKAKAQGAKSAAARAALAQVVAAQPPIAFYDKPLAVNDEMALAALIDIAEIRKLCKKKSAFREGDKILTYNRPFSEEMGKLIREKHPNADILNENPIYTE